jgi:hypothetical protein
MGAGDFQLFDFGATLYATAFFAPVMFAPGFVLGRATDILHFRRQKWLTQLLLSMVFSVAAFPILAYYTARLAGMGAAVTLYYAFAAAAVGILLRGAKWLAVSGREQSGDDVWPTPPVWILLVAAGFWIAVSLLVLPDLRVGAQLYRSVSQFDYAKHVMVTDAILRTGVPPTNPSFYPGKPVALFYYYFWFLVCAVVDRAGGNAVPVRTVVYASALWQGLALIAAMTLYISRVGVRNAQGRIVRPYGLVLALSPLMGLQSIFLLGRVGLRLIHRHGGALPLSLLWYSDQISDWPDTAIWTPHHSGGFIVCLTAMLLIRASSAEIDARRRAVLGIGAGIALASALGMSIWLTTVGCLILAVWFVVLFVQGDWRELSALVIAGFVMMVLDARYVLDLRAANLDTRSAVSVTVRQFVPVIRMLQSAHLPAPIIYSHIFQLILLPLNYTYELGVFVIGSLLYWRQRRRAGVALSRDEQLLLVCLAGSLFVASFLRSSLRNNDLGWRSCLYAQFVMLIWLAGLFRTPRALGRRGWSVIAIAAAMGALGIGYDLAAMRIRPGDHTRSQDLLDRNIFTALPRPLAGGEAMQVVPLVDVEEFGAMYSPQQNVASDLMYGALYGIGRQLFDPVTESLAKLTDPGTTTDQAAKICRQYHIGLLVLRATPKASPVENWSPDIFEPIAHNDRLLVFRVHADSPSPISKGSP